MELAASIKALRLTAASADAEGVEERVRRRRAKVISCTTRRSCRVTRRRPCGGGSNDDGDDAGVLVMAEAAWEQNQKWY